LRMICAFAGRGTVFGLMPRSFALDFALLRFDRANSRLSKHHVCAPGQDQRHIPLPGGGGVEWGRREDDDERGEFARRQSSKLMKAMAVLVAVVKLVKRRRTNRPRTLRKVRCCGGLWKATTRSRVKRRRGS
jgi:hypothetical protein